MIAGGAAVVATPTIAFGKPLNELVNAKGIYKNRVYAQDRKHIDAWHHMKNAIDISFREHPHSAAKAWYEAIEHSVAEPVADGYGHEFEPLAGRWASLRARSLEAADDQRYLEDRWPTLDTVLRSYRRTMRGSRKKQAVLDLASRIRQFHELAVLHDITEEPLTKETIYIPADTDVVVSNTSEQIEEVRERYETLGVLKCYFDLHKSKWTKGDIKKIKESYAFKAKLRFLDSEKGIDPSFVAAFYLRNKAATMGEGQAFLVEHTDIELPPSRGKMPWQRGITWTSREEVPACGAEFPYYDAALWQYLSRLLNFMSKKDGVVYSVLHEGERQLAYGGSGWGRDIVAEASEGIPIYPLMRGGSDFELAYYGQIPEDRSLYGVDGAHTTGSHATYKLRRGTGGGQKTPHIYFKGGIWGGARKMRILGPIENRLRSIHGQIDGGLSTTGPLKLLRPEIKMRVDAFYK